MKFNLDLGFGNLVVAGVAETSPLPLSLSFQWGPERREIRLIGDADLSFRSRFPLLPSAAALQVIIKCVHTHTQRRSYGQLIKEQMEGVGIPKQRTKAQRTHTTHALLHIIKTANRSEMPVR